MAVVEIDILESYTIEFGKDRIKTLEKYARHIWHDLSRLGVECDVFYSDTPRMTIRTYTGPTEKGIIGRHIKASMYVLGINVEPLT